MPVAGSRTSVPLHSDQSAASYLQERRMRRFAVAAVAACLAVITATALQDARSIARIHEVREEQEDAFRMALTRHAGRALPGALQEAERANLDRLNAEADAARDRALRS